MGTVSYLAFPPYFELAEQPEAFVVTMRFRKPLGSQLDAVALAKDRLGKGGADLDWSRVLLSEQPRGRGHEYVLTIPKLHHNQPDPQVAEVLR